MIESAEQQRRRVLHTWLSVLVTAGVLAACLQPPSIDSGLDTTGDGEQPGGGRPSSGFSELWGESGEAWSPQGRLPDFSWAGYRGGAVPLPYPPVQVDVRVLGARGDGITDDTGAFQAAIQAVDHGAIWIPPGRYRITEPLHIQKSHLVLRGAGRDETVLVFPRPLLEALGTGPEGGPHGWSWGGGWIWVHGSDRRADSRGPGSPGFLDGPLLARIASPAERGARDLELATAAPVTPGQWVRLIQHESDGSLTLHLHGGHPLGGRCLVDRPELPIIDWVVQVESVAGTKVRLARPLRVDVRPEWKPALHVYEPAVEEVGIEHLTIEFPLTEQPPHHHDKGFNAISLAAAFNCWVEDVAVVNFDTALFSWYSRHCTIRQVLLTGRGGHYSLHAGGTQDVLITQFRMENESIHDLSTANLGNGTVFSRGEGINVNIDFHRGAPYENLYSDIDVGAAWNRKRLWRCSGTPSGHYTAARETFWNLRPGVNRKHLPVWPLMNLIGQLSGKKLPAEVLAVDPWLESVKDLHPPDLHAAQLARRLGRELPPPEPLPGPRSE